MKGPQHRDKLRNIEHIRGKFKARVLINGYRKSGPLRSTIDEAAADAVAMREEQACHRTTPMLAMQTDRDQAFKKASKSKFLNITPVDGKFRANLTINNVRKWGPHRSTIEDAVRDLTELKAEQRTAKRNRMAETAKRAAVYVRFRNRFKSCLRGINAGDRLRSLEAVGCSWDDLNKHLRSRLRHGHSLEDPDMSIDHIFPISRYDLSILQHQRMANHYSNLQPIPMHENNTKRAKLPTLAEALLVEEWCWPPGITRAMLN